MCIDYSCYIRGFLINYSIKENALEILSDQENLSTFKYLASRRTRPPEETRHLAFSGVLNFILLGTCPTGTNYVFTHKNHAYSFYIYLSCMYSSSYLFPYQASTTTPPPTPLPTTHLSRYSIHQRPLLSTAFYSL